ncbi:MAG: nitroreductase [Caldithrix sp.]|nr:nitroreductase [Caldithrix sp.]
MNFEELHRKTRSYRRFKEEEPIPTETLKYLVNLARIGPSAANLQSLKYIICNHAETNLIIFTHVAWAGYLKDWQGPAPGERPSAYILILNDCNISKKLDCDHGIAAQTIILGAAEKGYGSCILGSVKRDELRKQLQIDANLEIRLIIALGVPNEKVYIDQPQDGDAVTYWRDEKDIHHVPKRELAEILIKTYTKPKSD